MKEIKIAMDLLGDASLESFKDNEMQKRAICMTVVNIGELVKGLEMDTRAEYKNIPWKAMAGFRDVTAHRYQTLNMEDVYMTVVEEFPSILNDMLQIDLEED
ncbi:MAG: DUF86 domain-containing protein [Lachnospiraceae bacterium]|nr:DUF86 domain-containing protein [Lachnospiraceae bacterium]